MSASVIGTILGTWRMPQPTSPVELEAQVQTISATQTPLPTSITITPPKPTHTHSPAARLSPEGTDPVNESFRATRTTTVANDSRHDVRLTTMSTTANLTGRGQGQDTPPPYPHTHHRYSISTNTNIEHDLPAYNEALTTEPITLAQHLFKFGFLFPPLWLLGLIILFSPITTPSDFYAQKPEPERAELARVMRRAEVKWAKRCAWALGVFVFVVGAIVGAVLCILKGRI